MMLRYAAMRLVGRLPATTTKHMNIQTCTHMSKRHVTSSQKRALTKEQVSATPSKGKGTSATATASSKTSSTTGDAAASTTSTTGGGGGEGGASSSSPSPLPILAMLGVAAGGAIYINRDSIPGLAKEEEPQPATSTPAATPGETKKEPNVEVAVKTVETSNVLANKETTQKSIVSKETPQVKVPSSKSIQPNRVRNIQVPSPNGRVSEPLPPTSHDTDGNRVSPAAFQKVYLQDTVILNEATPTTGPSTSDSTPPPPTAELAQEALEELQPKKPSVVDESMAKEEAKMRASADATLQNLDSLTESQLRVRVVQLVSEISDRTKWEAVRLKEFLTMKEREVGER